MDSSPTTLCDLPFEILQAICMKLSCIKEYVVFGDVCSLWRVVLFHCRQQIPPLLMNPNLPLRGHIVVFRHTVFCCPDLCNHVLSSEGFSACLGSSYGWLITGFRGTIGLWNPFLSFNNVIQLPRPSGHGFIDMVILSNEPLKTSNFVVMIIYSGGKLEFLKAGDTSWTHIDYNRTVQAIAYYDDQLYAISYLGELISCNVNTTPTSVKRVDSFGWINYFKRLVVSAGNLLCVAWDENDDGRQAVGFRVFNVETKNGELLELNSLGGHAIFVSRTSCVSLPAPNNPNCKSDCIYFTTSRVSGVFNVIDKTIRHFELPEFNTRPLWIQPTLNMIETTNRIQGSSVSS
ncbi:hypothetical protein ACHQM5_015059 [Ranunculus cassubicifolius]